VGYKEGQNGGERPWTKRATRSAVARSTLELSGFPITEEQVWRWEAAFQNSGMVKQTGETERLLIGWLALQAGDADGDRRTDGVTASKPEAMRSALDQNWDRVRELGLKPGIETLEHYLERVYLEFVVRRDGGRRSSAHSFGRTAPRCSLPDFPRGSSLGRTVAEGGR